MKNISLILIILISVLLNTSCKNQNANHIKNVITITEVFGDGQKLTAIAVEYDENIKNSSLSNESFDVEGRTISKIYTHETPAKDFLRKDGKFVIIELSLADTNAHTFTQRESNSILTEPKISIKQLRNIETSDGEIYNPTTTFLKSNQQINIIVDDFKQLEYKDKETGKTLPYNLFIPKDYDKDKKYPLVMFIHDVGSNSTNVMTTLVQGLGAVIWATPLEQSKHECFVLAPQYASQIVNDDSEASEYLDITIRLIEKLMHEYNIDWNRIYATGQSGGCMMSIAMNIKYPDFFTASFLVAGQWDPTKVSSMVNDKLWIIVSEGDEKAFPGMNAITDALQQQGARVSRAVWDGNWTPAEFADHVESMIIEDTNIKYVVLRKGTVVPENMQDNSGNNHRRTWQIAYSIEGIHDWLLRQEKE